MLYEPGCQYEDKEHKYEGVWQHSLDLSDGGNLPSHIPAHESAATVASFRTWRGLQPIIAREPGRSPQALN